MTSITNSTTTDRAGFWRSTLGCGILLFSIYSLAAALVEPFSGGCMFVIPIFFYALVTVLGVLKLQRFGAGAALFLLLATVGAAMDYYGDWVNTKNLISPWAALGWAPVFLGFGFAVDLAYRFAPAGWSPRRRSIFMGVVFGLAFYLLVRFALSVYYPPSEDKWHLWYFTYGVYFTLPWLYYISPLSGMSSFNLSAPVTAVLTSFGMGLTSGVVYRYRGFALAVLTHAVGDRLIILLLASA